MPFNPNWSHTYQRLPLRHAHSGAAARARVPPERLCIIDPVPTRATFHRVMGLADVYLDAFRSPAPARCSIRSWHWCRRWYAAVAWTLNHGAALMQMVGLDELSCDSEAQYIAKAIAWPPMAATQRIRERLHSSPKRPYPCTTTRRCSRPG